MTDPNLLTKEAGFVEGEDLKLRHRHSDGDFDVLGKLIKITSRGIVLEIPLAAKGGITVLFSDILDVRPVSGPMAIWNFAPEWATHCEIREKGDVWWWKLDDIIPEPEKRITARPWWAEGKASE